MTTKTPITSLRARWLGERLRAERTKAGYTLKDVAEYLGVDFTSLGRFERGTHRIRHSYVRDLINFYGISEPKSRNALLKLNEDSWRRDWWDGDTRDLEVGFIDYSWLEASAHCIRHFETMLIPGLLQTREYARTIMLAARDFQADRDELERLLELRSKRQEILSGESPTPLSVVFEESVLRRIVGGRRVFGRQLAKLLAKAEESHISIRVRPETAEWQPGLGSPFTYFSMDDPYPDVAYVENIAGRTFLEEQAKVELFNRAYHELCDSALTPEQSLARINQVREEIE
ncbi:helix-turn-helix protein [Stackebrandtia endophytica]|uniref:Helix-turn-helix protein n=1 Tax=Stackebrandtia endophytica TaxID=1496996 RepID=A0A543AV49_9ACTN|nr:helix-turn-helix transcriptional regulator [Stackebrandtia endophytica]TQL76427.1 helix-turn-helix protein [Stackebrandtia endophytica]